jgi:hypothetical protein
MSGEPGSNPEHGTFGQVSTLEFSAHGEEHAESHARAGPLLVMRPRIELPNLTLAFLEFEHYDLRIRAQPQRRSPGSGSARSENLHFPDPA